MTGLWGSEGSFRVVDLRAQELVGVIDVDGFPGGEEVERAEASRWPLQVTISPANAAVGARRIA